MSDATRFRGLEKKIKAELDNLVPEFGESSRWSCRFFGHDNAVDAGTVATKKMPLPEARRLCQIH